MTAIGNCLRFAAFLLISSIMLPSVLHGAEMHHDRNRSHNRLSGNMRTEVSDTLSSSGQMLQLPEPIYKDSLPFVPQVVLIFSGVHEDVEKLPSIDTTVNVSLNRSYAGVKSFPDATPQWLKEASRRWQASKKLNQMRMTGPAHEIHFFAWQLPEPPELSPITEAPVLPVMGTIPSALPSLHETPSDRMAKRHWLHVVNLGLQFSQAYVSPNWYQGGDNSLTILSNLMWSVKLNKVYHPNLLLESTLQYKLGLYSTPNDEYHKYAISEDLLQYNLTSGVKAFKRWYYSFTMQFKTQMLHNYSPDSWERKASFLSPGELNLGIGMTYSNENKKKGITFQASIAPLSYNLRTCIDSKVDPTLFNIKAGRKSSNEFGSTAELTMTWKLAPNITWSQRMFLFSDYSYFSGDWEHTFNFSINRFLSTQLYIHGRYDTSVPSGSKGWKKWMLKEILSFGFAYAFTTIPPKK